MTIMCLVLVHFCLCLAVITFANILHTQSKLIDHVHAWDCFAIERSKVEVQAGGRISSAVYLL